MFCAGFDSMVPISLAKFRYRAIRFCRGPLTSEESSAYRLTESEAKTVNDTSIHGNNQPGTVRSPPGGQRGTSPDCLDEPQGLTRVSIPVQQRYTIIDVPISNQQPVQMLDLSRQFAGIREELLATIEAVCTS